jgi:SAM-dependent methyltransferase
MGAPRALLGYIWRTLTCWLTPSRIEPLARAAMPPRSPKRAGAVRQAEPPCETLLSPPPLALNDEALLHQARIQWQFGDWASLASITHDQVQHHPDRAKLALLAASGLHQVGRADEAKALIGQALDWGCSPHFARQIVVSGIHNTLGRANAILGNEQEAVRHFGAAVDTGAQNTDHLVQIARATLQLNQIGLPAAFQLCSNDQPQARATAEASPKKDLHAGVHEVAVEQNSGQVAGGLRLFRMELPSQIDSEAYPIAGGASTKSIRVRRSLIRFDLAHQFVSTSWSSTTARPNGPSVGFVCAVRDNLATAAQAIPSRLAWDSQVAPACSAIVNARRSRNTPNTRHPTESEKFYVAFENRFRGTMDDIRDRLRVYVPFVAEASANRPDLLALDLGCGRGEFLDLLTSAGLRCEGIDSNSEMIRLCRESGFIAKVFDALEYLQSLPSESRACISMIHTAEHFPFDYLHALVREAHRTLVSHGILIIETPNPENFLMGGCDFYIDPTHTRPIPPSQLQFVLEYEGFSRTKTLHLQEDQEVASKQEFNLYDLIAHVSPDYAVIGLKADSDKALIDESPHWKKDYGLGRTHILKEISKHQGQSD